MAKKRILSVATTAAALDAAKACRSAAVQVLTEAPIHGPAYREASALLEAIDQFALALTGDARLFHTKPHAVG